MTNDKTEATFYPEEGAEAVYREPKSEADGLIQVGRDQVLAELDGLEPTPTQVRRPWRSTARTLFQALVAMAVLFPILVESTGLKPEDAPWLAIPLAVAAAVARAMALPQVENFLARFLPFLAAAPQPPAPPAEENTDEETEPDD